MTEKQLYVQMFSIHGLIRQNNLELGRNADTGGQTRYVIEMARALSELSRIRKVDIFTRQISDSRFSKDYAVKKEIINKKCRIIRIRCGGRRYIAKEKLWPHLDEFVNRTITFIKQQQDIPDIVHGHYADAGYVARRLTLFFGLPFVFTGHSLGRSKQSRLLESGMKQEDIERRFKMKRRLEVEEEVLENADLIIASTSQEVNSQYGAYGNGNLPDFAVIPPGVDLEKFYPYYVNTLPEINQHEAQQYAQASLLEELNRFLIHPDRPLVLTLCRPEKRKNISGLIRAYGEDLTLQTMANLAIFAGVRKDIESMDENEREVLTEMLLLMDRYDLYGKMAIPKTHDFEYEVPALYRIAAEKKGVFVNAALTEPFGLTLIEAAACGVPVVATADGGPRDILQNLKNGLLVNARNSSDIARSIRSIITEPESWKKYSRNGMLKVKEFYTWDAHVKAYETKIAELLKTRLQAPAKDSEAAIGRRLTQLRHFVICDMDDTLTGGSFAALERFSGLISDHRHHLGFGVATGRDINSALSHISVHNIPLPDLLISSVGTEIFYGGDHLFCDRGWQSHLQQRWKPDLIRSVLLQVDFLKPQPEEFFTPFKISYFMEPGNDRIQFIRELLNQNRLLHTIIYSSEKYLDILPYRASKGKAVRYFAKKWAIPLKQILVCGDSGNDAEMLRGDSAAVVVANHQPELDILRKRRNVFFSSLSHAEGVIEGIEHFCFIEKIREQIQKNE